MLCYSAISYVRDLETVVPMVMSFPIVLLAKPYLEETLVFGFGP